MDLRRKVNKKKVCIYIIFMYILGIFVDNYTHHHTKCTFDLLMPKLSRPKDISLIIDGGPLKRNR